MFWTKKAHQCTICQTFECSNESSPNTSCHFWNQKVRLYSNFASLFSVMKDNSSVFFRQTSYTLDKSGPSRWNFWTLECVGENSPNFSCHTYLKPQVRLSTAQVKFQQICALICSFCWKYIKFQLKSTKELCLVILKTGAKFEEKLIFVSKMTSVLIRAPKSLKKLYFDWSLSCKVYI